MPRRTVPLIADEYYHLYNRGVNRQTIFFEQENYSFFLRGLRRYLIGETKNSEFFKNSEFSTTIIIAYCLMPNHYHLLVRPHSDQLSRQMQRFSISYTRAVNKRYGRVGPLFQGQFQATHVDKDAYLTHLSRYIHLNPVAAGLVARPQDWTYSSYRDIIGLRDGTLPRPAAVLEQFPSTAVYRDFVEGPDDSGLEMIEHLLPD